MLLRAWIRLTNFSIKFFSNDETFLSFFFFFIFSFLVRKTVVLWKFLEELLDKGEENCVSWVSKEEGTFKFVDSKLAAKLWGQRKNKRNMTYEKLSRALRYYYDRRIMFHEEGQKLIYRFGEVVMKNRRPSTEESSSPIVNETM